MNNQSIIDVARGRFLGKHDVSPRVSPRHMGLQADRFSSDIRGFEGLLHKNKGNIINQSSPKSLSYTVSGLPNMFKATDTEYIA